MRPAYNYELSYTAPGKTMLATKLVTQMAASRPASASRSVASA